MAIREGQNWGGWADEARTAPWTENTITSVLHHQVQSPSSMNVNTLHLASPDDTICIGRALVREISAPSDAGPLAYCYVTYDVMARRPPKSAREKKRPLLGGRRGGGGDTGIGCETGVMGKND